MSKQISISGGKKQRQKPIQQDTVLQDGVGDKSIRIQEEQITESKAGKCIPINPKGEPLSLEKFRSFEGCNHYNDEEALEIIESLSTLARIVVATALKGGTPIDNQQVLHLESNIKSNKKAA